MEDWLPVREFHLIGFKNQVLVLDASQETYPDSCRPTESLSETEGGLIPFSSTIIDFEVRCFFQSLKETRVSGVDTRKKITVVIVFHLLPSRSTHRLYTNKFT